jgi:GntR family transcriptional repressor for pyruvate dehydrogenase complex
MRGTDLKEAVRTFLKRHIAQHRLRAGDPLPTEKELSTELGLSRTVIRESLQGLQELGVATSIQGKGYFLREFNFDAMLASFEYLFEPGLQSFRDLLEIRMYLESVYLTRDVFLFTPDDLEELERVIAAMDGKITEGAAEDELVNIHTEFHRQLYAHSNNLLLLELISMFSAMQHRLIAIHGYRTQDRREFIEEHRRIVEALRNRQPEMVRSVLISHFSEPLNWVRDKMAASEAEGASGV